jgi:glycosyltransferase involved in cell wall biosynthesis
MKTIGLCMIVKNESHVITRCLDSVKRLLDWVLIVDTGSTDNTPQVINEWLMGNQIGGEVVIEPWKNFAYNRTFALKKLHEKSDIDYALMIDADEILVFEENFDVTKFKSELWADIYDIMTHMGGLSYNRPTLTSNKRESRYEGVVHEFLAMSDGGSRDTARGFYNNPIQDSARNKSENKYMTDALLLEKALEDPDCGEWFRSRYTFYLAQSYRDAGHYEKSIEKYLERSKQGFWQEEVYISLYTAGNLKKSLNYPKEQIIQQYMDAHESLPHRAEALYAALNYCRTNGLNHQGYMIGKIAMSLNFPEGSLFAEKWVYDYGIIDEFSIVAFWSGRYQESKDACERLLQEKKIPEHYYDRVKSNLQFAVDRLG